jgi:hypothetical protein
MNSNALEHLDEELRGLPRHLWDQRLWQLCEQLVAEPPEFQPALLEKAAPARRNGGAKAA